MTTEAVSKLDPVTHDAYPQRRAVEPRDLRGPGLLGDLESVAEPQPASSS